MGRPKDKGRLQPFVPVDKEMMACAAWRQMSHGARWLYVHLKWRWNYKQCNNGRLYLSQRNAVKELGASRESIARWYRELQHYGFIVMTTPGCLGVNGMGMAPHWRLTEAEAPGGRNGNTLMLPTKDYLKWDGELFQDNRGDAKRQREKQNPGLESGARVASKSRPGLASKVVPVPPKGGLESGAIDNSHPGLESGAITSLTTSPAYSGTGSHRYAISDHPGAMQKYFGVGRHKYTLVSELELQQLEAMIAGGRPRLQHLSLRLDRFRPREAA
jgi:hypothetical protein